MPQVVMDYFDDDAAVHSSSSGVMMETVDVVVIGAGFSGLAAASALVKAGGGRLSVVVLEARDRVGGRTCNSTVRLSSGENIRVDAGGAYVGPTQDRVLRVADEVGIQTYPVFVDGLSCQALGDNRDVRRFRVPWPPLGVAALIDLNKMLVKMDDLAATVSADAPWEHPEATELDAITVGEWMRRNAWSTNAEKMVKLIINAVVCKEPEEVSWLWWLWYVRSGQGIVRLTDADNGAQERKFVQGSCTICERMAERLGRRCRLNSPVASVRQVCTRKGEINVPTSCIVTTAPTTTAGAPRTFRAAYVVTAVAPTLYSKISFSPPLPQPKLNLAHRVSMGTIIKTNAYYDRPYWREHGLCGSIVSHEGPVSYSMDDCGHDSGHASLMGFVLARHACEWSRKSRAERQRAIAEQYAEMLGIPELRSPIGYHEKNWDQEEWSQGCYIAVMPPGCMSSYGDALRAPAGRVHFAGTETATKWAGYMDGAVEAGERAAREVLLNLARDGVDGLPPLAPPVDEPPSTVVVPRPNDDALVRWLPGIAGFIVIAIVMLAAAATVVVLKLGLL